MIDDSDIAIGRDILITRSCGAFKQYQPRE